MYTDIASNPVTNGQNYVEIIEVSFSGYLSSPFNLNCSEFPNSCFRLQFSIFENISDVLTNGRFRYLIKITHCFLSHPDRIIFEIDINFGIAVFVLINQDFSGIFRFTAHCLRSSRLFFVCASIFILFSLIASNVLCFHYGTM